MRLCIKNLCLSFIILVLANGCFNVPDPNYKTRLSKVPAHLIEHFPAHLTDGLESSLITNTDTTSRCIYYLLFQYSQDAIRQIDSSTNNRAVMAKYEAGDTSIISVKRETVIRHNPEKYKDYSDRINKDNQFYPIPFFENKNEVHSRSVKRDIYSDSTLSGLSSDFMIHVYDFKRGKYWEGLSPQEYMPNGWENGYSKGIAISRSKKVAIYWFVVW